MYGGARAEKQRIRQEVRQTAANLSPEYRQEASREITRQVLALPFWKQAQTVMMYSSLPGEPDTRSLMEAALKEGKTPEEAAGIAWTAFENTKGMLAKHGRMAIRGEASRELLDPGAAVAALLMKGYAEAKA